MSLPENRRWVGQLSMARLFEGSKSEGLYPVLDTDDGLRLRVYVKGSSAEEALRDLMDHRVSLQGQADDLRGHWRLVLDPDSPGQLVTEDEPSDSPPAKDTP